ncbi:hypothetical protein TELCIR_10845 [Teladorsagia circumcincta]|uniref:Uncharacterized protein n=1 Tax=Teladorsagia circumcincta TaxID=45464 RepID=A0A2G9UB13_TELCI|nr:hypothetical protein TELCIR_10845 [Teladorsagia circumcincta]
MQWHSLTYFAFWSLRNIICVRTEDIFLNATISALHSSISEDISRKSSAYHLAVKDVSSAALTSLTGHGGGATHGAVTDSTKLPSTVHNDVKNITTNSTLDGISNTTLDEKDGKRENVSLFL